MPGTLYIIATPIGNLEDITFRALRILKQVDLIAAEDTRVTRKLLSHFDIHTNLTSFFKANENQKADKIIDALLQGTNIALVSDGGTPCISDPGFPLLKKAVDQNITVVPIPGPCAVTTALSASGLPTDRFTFVGFLPDKSGKRKKALEELKSIDHTLVFYVSKWKIAKTINDMLEIYGDKKACLCRELTKIHEEFIRNNLSDILQSIEKKPPKGEITLIVDMK